MFYKFICLKATNFLLLFTIVFSLQLTHVRISHAVADNALQQIIDSSLILGDSTDMDGFNKQVEVQQQKMEQKQKGIAREERSEFFTTESSIPNMNNSHLDSIFTSEYTQVDSSIKQKKQQQNLNILSDFIDPEVKDTIESILKETKESAKLKAFEYGLIDENELLSKNGQDALIPPEKIFEQKLQQQQLISEEKSNIDQQNFGKVKYPSKGTQLEETYDNEKTQAFYGKIKLISISLIILYMVYKLSSFIFRHD